ncbi:MAG TPA: hypothetical protein VFE34_24695 [Dongiaceae bacterium]|jgi:hypothetical protein|nr:hypothetical protein [Dongiaceae bacterium]
MSKHRFRMWGGGDDDWMTSEANSSTPASLAAIEPSPAPILPEFDAGNFRKHERIDNPYFPLLRGTVYTYGVEPEEAGEATERNDVFATFENKKILGVNTHVVRDTAYADGLLIEDTLDYFAQDKKGNVWYFGELTYAFEYDDDGKFLGTTTEGSWLADGMTAFPGYAMPTRDVLEALGNGYRQEFAPGIAEDQADLVSFKATADIDIGFFKDVLQTLDTTQLEPDAREFKKYEPGVGLVSTEELNQDGEVEALEQLLGIRLLKEGDIGHELFKDRGDPDLKDLIEDDIGVNGFEQPELRDFRYAGSDVHVTFLGGDTESNDALGFYTFDRSTGLIDDVDILFRGTDDLESGQEFVTHLDKGEGYGLFLVPNGAEIGLDLSAFEDGGLEMRNFLTGNQASIYDRMAPQLVDEDGTVLPIPAFHALDVNTQDDWNLLNPAGGIQAVELDSDTLEKSSWEDKAEVLGFEDMFATDPERDGDFDDVVVAVSRTPLPANLVADVTEDLNLAA